MTLATIAEHTVDIDLLKQGFVLDAGCRNFIFARELARLGCSVVAVDADPTVEYPSDFRGIFLNVALATESGERNFLMHSNPEARHLVRDGIFSFPTTKVRTTTISNLMDFYSIESWDVVKLDIEGAEYDILQQWPGPIAKQISIEFHEHCGPRPKELYDSIFEHLSQWYKIAQHEKEARHCAGENWWDTLLIRKGT
ncbi:MAG: Methyltransferase, FkbM family protein [Parcubacteria group bacterium GW2011_GWB1_56_8]|nr:MAG: Methyltransferase, FkbM family protein [Parcubacteria group bacterium GW2011_GWB1_56_8]